MLDDENEENKPQAPALTQEEMEQLNADPSLLIDNPEFEAKLDATIAASAEVPAAEAETPAPENPTPEVPAPAASTPLEGQVGAGAQPPAAVAPEIKIPSWVEHIPEAERQGVLETWIKGLPKAERAKLAPVAELLREVDAQAEQRGASAAVQQQEAEERLTSIEDAFGVFKANLAGATKNGALLDLDALATPLVEAASAAKQNEMAGYIRSGLGLTLQAMRITEIPGEVLAQAEKAKDPAAALNIYSVFIANQGFNQGVAYAQGQSVKDAKTAEVVDKARMRDEIMGDLAKEGLLKSTAPPTITAQGGGGAASEVTDDEIRRYEQLVANDPESVPQDLEQKVERHFAAALAGTK